MNPSATTREKAEIETLVQQRLVRGAEKKIQRLLQQKLSKNPALVFEACDWLRRLGLYQKAYQLLEIPHQQTVRVQSTENFVGRKRLYGAWMLNQMGASQMAFQMIAGLNPSSAFDARILGQIYLVNFEYQKAYDIFKTMQELDLEPDSYASRFAQIEFADALVGLGKTEEALAIIDKIIAASAEPILLGIAYQARGEYLARNGQFKAALRELEKANEYFPKSENTVDRALLDKWLGYAHGMMGNREQSQGYFLKAEKILNGGMRAEGLISLLRLKADTGQLPQSQKKKLAWYPGFPARFESSSQEVFFGTDRASFYIDLTAEEFRWKQQKVPSLPLEIKLLAGIRSASRWGISVVRAKDFLWPEEAYSYLQLEKRLQALIHRLRNKYKIEVEVRNNRIRLPLGSKSQVAVRITKSSSPSFLRANPSFSRREVEDFYGISASGAKDLIRRWASLKLVQSVGQGPSLSYCSQLGTLA